MAATTAPEAPAKGKRKGLLIVVFIVLLIAAGLWAAWWFLSGRFYESTDDAYVNGNIVQITPQIAGTVVAVGADDTDFVKPGQVLVRLDRADAKVALDRAEAQLARSVRQVRNQFAVDSELESNVDLRRVELNKNNDDLARREKAGPSGAVSQEEIQHARDAVKSAQASLAGAERQLAANRVLVDNTTLSDHPDVMNAATQVHDAYINWARTELPAPVAGFVAKKNVQIGQRVSAGNQLMAIVPLEQVWVDANFKENQLANLREGQPVKIYADLYGGRVEYHGKLEGFGAGTGGAFALLPAQNATGNWIKVVQRIPVRIALDPKELAQHPLQVGLSMRAEVDTHGAESQRLPELASKRPPMETNVFASVEDRANQRIAEIIAANSGKTSRAKSASHTS
jgi:membrane fusion protein (multidrug efflux system)